MVHLKHKLSIAIRISSEEDPVMNHATVTVTNQNNVLINFTITYINRFQSVEYAVSDIVIHTLQNSFIVTDMVINALTKQQDFLTVKLQSAIVNQMFIA